MYYDNSQIELKRSQLNPSQCRHFHTFMSVCWHGIAIDAYKLPSSLTDIGQLFRHFKLHKWQLTKQKYNILSILFESKKAFATFEVNIIIRVLCTTDYQIFYFATKNFQLQSYPTGQPKFLDALFSDNSYSYVLPFTCIIEALNSSLKSGSVLQVHRKLWMTDQTLKMNHAQLAMLRN